MDTENKNSEVQGKLLELPEVVAGAAPVDFPEISDFLKSMKIKGSLFGFQKEDVYEKMQQLNGLYQTRVQQMREQSRGQLKQMKRQMQEELEEAKREAKRAAEQELAEAKQRAILEAQEESRVEVEKYHRELALVQGEMERLIERLQVLKSRVQNVTGEK